MSKQLNFDPQQEFEVITYPGRVLNADRMLNTLGGITKISRVFTGEEKRLQLRYHSDNPYNKAAFSDSKEKIGILLSVTVRRSKKDPNKPAKYYVRVLGHCPRVHVFESLCDFQYLPLCKVPNMHGLQFVLDQLAPCNATDLEYFKNKNAPFFCIPELFARVDIVHTGVYRIDAGETGQHDVLGVLQKSAYDDNRNIVQFSMTDEFPTKPDPQMIKRMKVKYVSDEQFDCIKKLFKQCPIWTRIALLYESGITIEKLKYITPSLAYYFSSGPWRMLYVRYGYDPRKDFKSRYYQAFDFRLKISTGVSEFVYSRKTSARNRQPSGRHDLMQNPGYPYLEPNKLPRSRQCMLRFCDVHLEEVQDMIAKIPPPKTEVDFNEVTGWLPPCFDQQVRHLVCNNIKELLRKYYRKDQLNAEVAVDQPVGDNIDEDDEIVEDEIDAGANDNFVVQDEPLEQEELMEQDETLEQESNIDVDHNIENFFNIMTNEI